MINRKTLTLSIGLIIILAAIPATVLITRQIQTYRSGAQEFPRTGINCGYTAGGDLIGTGPASGTTLHPDEKCRTFIHPDPPVVTTRPVTVPLPNPPGGTQETISIKITGSLCFLENVSFDSDKSTRIPGGMGPIGPGDNNRVFLSTHAAPRVSDTDLARRGQITTASKIEANDGPMCGWTHTSASEFFQNEENPLRFEFEFPQEVLLRQIKRHNKEYGECPADIYLHYTGTDRTEAYNIYRIPLSSINNPGFQGDLDEICKTETGRQGICMDNACIEVPPGTSGTPCNLDDPNNICAQSTTVCETDPLTGPYCKRIYGNTAPPECTSQNDCLEPVTVCDKSDNVCRYRTDIPDPQNRGAFCNELNTQCNDETHTVCNQGQVCVEVQGRGQNECDAGLNNPTTGINPLCSQSLTHTVCDNSQSCVEVQGKGQNECNANLNNPATGINPICNPSLSHTVCRGLTCVSVEGTGQDDCNIDQNNPLSGVNPLCSTEQPPFACYNQACVSIDLIPLDVPITACSADSKGQAVVECQDAVCDTNTNTCSVAVSKEDPREKCTSDEQCGGGIPQEFACYNQTCIAKEQLPAGTAAISCSADSQGKFTSECQKTVCDTATNTCTINTDLSDSRNSCSGDTDCEEEEVKEYFICNRDRQVCERKYRAPFANEETCQPNEPNACRVPPGGGDIPTGVEHEALVVSAGVLLALFLSLRLLL